MKMNFSKYKAKKVEFDGIKFDSQMECNFYKGLKELGLNFEIKTTFELQPKFTYKGKNILPIKYECDYIVEDKWVIDVKGMKTSDFKLKEKMFKYKYGDKYDFVCLTTCPKKYLQQFIDNNSDYWWVHIGFIENDVLEKLRKENKKLLKQNEE